MATKNSSKPKRPAPTKRASAKKPAPKRVAKPSVVRTSVAPTSMPEPIETTPELVAIEQPVALAESPAEIVVVEASVVTTEPVAVVAPVVSRGPVVVSEADIEEALAAMGASVPPPIERPGVMQLGSSLSIREVGERAAQLRTRLETGALVVDGGQLESIDSAGMQLLMAAALAAKQRGTTMKLTGAGKLISNAAAALGLTEHLAAAAEIVS